MESSIINKHHYVYKGSFYFHLWLLPVVANLRFGCFNQSLREFGLIKMYSYCLPGLSIELLILIIICLLQRWRVVTQANAKSKSEKFPPPHQDGAVGYPLDTSHKGPVSFGAPDASFGSSMFNSKSSGSVKGIGATGGPSRRRKTNKEDPNIASSRKFIRAFKPSSIGLSMNLLFKTK